MGGVAGHTVISAFISILISSQDATINIELCLLWISLQVWGLWLALQPCVGRQREGERGRRKGGVGGMLL